MAHEMIYAVETSGVGFETARAVLGRIPDVVDGTDDYEFVNAIVDNENQGIRLTLRRGGVGDIPSALGEMDDDVVELNEEFGIGLPLASDAVQIRPEQAENGQGGQQIQL